MHAGPDRGYFDVMADHGSSHWWYVARRRLVTDLLGPRRRGGVAVDVGCGTGHTLATLRELGYGPVLGSDLEDYALRHAGATVVCADARSLPLPDAVAGCVVALDVLEHIADEHAALGEWRRVLQPRGTLVVTVPAYQSLYSDFDRWACHERRYSRSRLRDRLVAAGFEVDRLSHFNSFLVPPAWAARRTPLRRYVQGGGEDASGGLVAGRVLGALAAAERRALRRRDLPAGLSIVALATARA